MEECWNIEDLSQKGLYRLSNPLRPFTDGKDRGLKQEETCPWTHHKLREELVLSLLMLNLGLMWQHMPSLSNWAKTEDSKDAGQQGNTGQSSRPSLLVVITVNIPFIIQTRILLEERVINNYNGVTANKSLSLVTRTYVFLTKLMRMMMVRRPTTTAKRLMIFRYWAEPFASTSSFNLPQGPASRACFSHLRKLQLQEVESLVQGHTVG